MAQNPKSAGIGTGAAQVYDYSRIDRAMANAFDVVNQKKARQAEREDEAKKEKEEALKKLRGDFKYDTSKIKDVDRSVVTEKVSNLNKTMDGHWEDVLNGDPYWSNLYRQMTDEVKNYIGDSADSKTEELALYKKALEPDSGYSQDKIKHLEELWTTPGVTPSKLREEGAYSRDQIIGNIFDKVDQSLLSPDSDFYNEVDKQFRGADGSFSHRRVKQWLPDSEAKPKFITTVQGSPELMQDMNIKYGDLEPEEMMDAFYNDYKNSRIDEKEITSFGAAPIDKSSKKDDETGTLSIFQDEGGDAGFTMASNKPTTVTIKGGKGKPSRTVWITPSSFVRTPGGWGVKAIAYKKGWAELSEAEKTKYVSESNYYETVPGDEVEVPATSAVRAKFKSQYGLDTDWDNIYKNLKGGDTPNVNQDPLGIF